jgi:hypothetical protein
MDEKTRKFIAHFPLPERVSLKKAAEILDDSDAIQNLLSEIACGHIFSWSHSPASGTPISSFNHSLSFKTELPQITTDTDPAKVFIEGKEVRWRWCVRYEEKLQLVDHAKKETVEARERIVLQQANETMITAIQAPLLSSQVELKMLASRQQLIKAFGNFTGMDINWFTNLNDSPRLKAARKYVGQGGRQRQEPLFCPYEVMQWLLTPKRKKGRPLSEDAAWRMLKINFPAVYASRSVGDPNPD